MTASEYEKACLGHDERVRDVIAVHRSYLRVTQDLAAGIMLSQILYWFGRNEDGHWRTRIVDDAGCRWLAKRHQDWMQECFLTADQARRCLSLLESKGLVRIETKKFGGNPTTHIAVNWQVLFDALKANAKPTQPSPERSGPEPRTEMGQNPEPSGPRPSSYTESTAKTTTEIKTITPLPPSGDLLREESKLKRNSGRQAQPLTELKTYCENCKAESKLAIPDDDPVFAYIDKIGLPQSFLDLAWKVFSKRLWTGKRYRSWPQAFRNYVERDYLKLWYRGADGEWGLTTAGKQAALAYEQKAA